MPVVNYYREQNKVVEVSQFHQGFLSQKLTHVHMSQVDAKDTIDGVYAKVKVAVEKSLAAKHQ